MSDKKRILAQIEEKWAQARQLLSDAEDLAKENGIFVFFSMTTDGETYEYSGDSQGDSPSSLSGKQAWNNSGCTWMSSSC